MPLIIRAAFSLFYLKYCIAFAAMQFANNKFCFVCKIRGKSQEKGYIPSLAYRKKACGSSAAIFLSMLRAVTNHIPCVK